MMNAREVIARALCLSHGDDPDREGPWAEWWSESAYARQADAALSAIEAAGGAIVPVEFFAIPRVQEMWTAFQIAAAKDQTDGR